MSTEPTQRPSRQDYAQLRAALFRLTATPRILVMIVVVAVALVWYDLLNRLLAFGDGIDYAGLHVVGTEATNLLQQYNPFFWWVVVALCTIIIAYFLYLLVQSTARRTRLRPVDEASFERLARELSAPALSVLLWAWRDRDEPLRVGDLQRTRDELRADRAGKLQRAARQLAILEQSQRTQQP